MRKFICFLLLAACTVTDHLVLDNRTPYPSDDSKLAVQWAASAKEVDEGNDSLLHGMELKNVRKIRHTGNVHLAIPQNAKYFRVLLWSKGSEDPDFHTNWVEIVPDKVYTLKPDQLVPTVLLFGTGC